MAVVCIDTYFLIADFAFLFIAGTCYTNPANTNDTHLQIGSLTLQHKANNSLEFSDIK